MPLDLSSPELKPVVLMGMVGMTGGVIYQLASTFIKQSSDAVKLDPETEALRLNPDLLNFRSAGRIQKVQRERIAFEQAVIPQHFPSTQQCSKAASRKLRSPPWQGAHCWTRVSFTAARTGRVVAWCMTTSTRACYSDLARSREQCDGALFHDWVDACKFQYQNVHCSLTFGDFFGDLQKLWKRSRQPAPRRVQGSLHCVG